MRCEDYPCCGHGTDQHGNPDCPDSQGRFTCVGCGKRLPKNSPDSYCNKCRHTRGRFYDIDHDYSMDY